MTWKRKAEYPPSEMGVNESPSKRQRNENDGSD